MKVDGACACGAIRIEAEADPENTNMCHCTDCQTATGTTFRVSVRVPGEMLKITGKPSTYVKTTAESGNPRVQAFCGTCGSPLYSTTVGDGVQPLYMLRVGILRQRSVRAEAPNLVAFGAAMGHENRRCAQIRKTKLNEPA